MKPCFVCGTVSEGAISKSNIRITSICQNCKDNQDYAVAEMVRALAKTMDFSNSLVFKHKEKANV